MIEEIMAIINELNKIVRNVPDTGTMSVIIAMLIDQWAADHDIPAEDACSICKGIVSRQAEAWRIFGPLKKTTGETP